MGVAGPIFELHPSNLVRNHIFYSCKSAEILVRLSQVVLNLAKSVWSVLSISSDVRGQDYQFWLAGSSKRHGNISKSVFLCLHTVLNTIVIREDTFFYYSYI